MGEYPYKGLYDIRTAASRTLRDYLAALEFEDANGRKFKFEKAYYEWPDAEVTMSMPSLSIAPGAVDYPTDLSHPPSEIPGTWYPEGEDGFALFQTGEASMKLQADVWCSNRGERHACVKGIEQAFSTGDGYSTLILNAGDYYWSRAIVFGMGMTRFDDDEDSASKRYRRATVEVTARAPIVVKIAVKAIKGIRQDMYTIREVQPVGPGEPTVEYDPFNA